MFNKIPWLAIAFLLTGCVTSKSSLPNRKTQTLTTKIKQIIKPGHYQGHYKVGQPYVIKNKKYHPKQYNYYSEVGMASWYGKRYGFHGKLTANGEIFDTNSLSAAHKTLPLPCIAKVTNLKNKKSIIVLVNDRGPFHKDRIIDLSERAADVIDVKNDGVAKVKVQYLKQETNKFLKQIKLHPKHGAKAKEKMDNPTCNTKCKVKTINHVHKLKH